MSSRSSGANSNCTPAKFKKLHNGRTMDLVKFREKFDGLQTPAGDGRRKPRSMPRGRRQARLVAGSSAGAPVKAGSDGQGPGTEGESPGETGDGRRRRRTAKAAVEANDGRREARSVKSVDGRSVVTLCSGRAMGLCLFSPKPAKRTVFAL